MTFSEVRWGKVDKTIRNKCNANVMTERRSRCKRWNRLSWCLCTIAPAQVAWFLEKQCLCYNRWWDALQWRQIRVAELLLQKMNTTGLIGSMELVAKLSVSGRRRVPSCGSARNTGHTGIGAPFSDTMDCSTFLQQIAAAGFAAIFLRQEMVSPCL